MKYCEKKHMMGTDISLTIISDNNALTDINNCFKIFLSFEKEFSRFIDDSSLSTLNKNKTHKVSDRFIEVFNHAKKVNQLTNDSFNFLVNLKEFGYKSDFKKGEFEKQDINSDLNTSLIGVNGNTIRLGKSQNIDLGGIVKGYGVDQIKKYLLGKGYEDFIINAGGDIFISGNNEFGKTPIVAIDSPFNKEEIFATISLKNKSISTSGIYKRKWKIDNKEYNHIINPELSSNNNEIISVTIVDDECYLSDSIATACIAMGLNKSLRFLETNNIDGIIIGSDGNMYKTKGMENYNLKII